MSEKAIIMAGLVIFLALVTFPFWYSPVAGQGAAVPDLPPDENLDCVRDAEWMKANHMNLLDQWRNDVVRGTGAKEDCTFTVTVTLPSGEQQTRQYAKSLTGTCLQCHTMQRQSSTKRSCAQCHDYANVEPRCMDCHVEPRGN